MRFLSREKQQAGYSFYVWENGSYVHADGGQFENDTEAAAVAAKCLPRECGSIQRPVSLDAPHLHVVREDGVHILTLELTD